MNFKQLFVLLISASLYSQVPKGFSIAAAGVQTSLNSDAVAFGDGTGYGAGFAFHWGYYETFNYQLDLIYSFNSLSLPYTEFTGEKGIEKMKTETLDVIWCFNYYFLVPEEDRFYMGVQGGGDITVLGQKWQPYGNSRVYSGNLDDSSFKGMPDFGAGLTFGVIAGYNRFKLSAKYNMGLTNILKNVETAEYDESHSYIGPAISGKLSSMSVTLYYKIW